VRRWLRAARDDAHLEWLRVRGTRTAVMADIDGAVVARIAPAGSRLGDALTAPAAAVAAVRRRFPELATPDWALIAVTAGGRRQSLDKSAKLINAHFKFLQIIHSCR